MTAAYQEMRIGVFTARVAGLPRATEGRIEWGRRDELVPMPDPIVLYSPDTKAPKPAVPVWGPLASSGYGTAAWNRRHADEIGQTIPFHLVLFYFRPYANRETRIGGTRVRSASAASGSCVIVPAHADYWARWHEPKEVAAFTLSPTWLDSIAEADLDLPSARVASDGLPIVDRRVGMMGQMLREQLREGDETLLSPLGLDSILNLLGIHLLKNYVTTRPLRDLGGISDRQLGLIRDYMTAHLAESVRLNDIAAIVNLSSSQLLRSFKKRVGTSPHHFLTRLRLDRARSLILETSRPLAEIALDCGFSNQSHLTASMRKEDGLTPGALRT